MKRDEERDDDQVLSVRRISFKGHIGIPINSYGNSGTLGSLELISRSVQRLLGEIVGPLHFCQLPVINESRKNANSDEYGSHRRIHNIDEFRLEDTEQEPSFEGAKETILFFLGIISVIGIPIGLAFVLFGFQTGRPIAILMGCAGIWFCIYGAVFFMHASANPMFIEVEMTQEYHEGPEAHERFKQGMSKLFKRSKESVENKQLPKRASVRQAKDLLVLALPWPSVNLFPEGQGLSPAITPPLEEML